MPTNSSDPADEPASQVDPGQTAAELIGHQDQLRGHVLYTGLKLGILERLNGNPATPDEIAAELDLDTAFTFRLVRALGAFDVLEADSEGQFSVTPVGDRFLSDWPEPYRAFVLFFYHPDRLAAIQHFPEIVAEGGPDGYTREYGHGIYEHCERNPAFADAFNGFQTLTSIPSTEVILETLSEYDFSQFSTACDVGGGRGEFLANFLDTHPQFTGTVLDLPSVIEHEERLWAERIGIEERCEYVAGDMFDEVPSADIYFMKAILHNWSDEKCIQILSNVKNAASDRSRIFVIDRVLSETDISASSARLDMWMMVEVGGRERTESEFNTLFERAGLEIERILETDSEISLVEGVVA